MGKYIKLDLLLLFMVLFPFNILHLFPLLVNVQTLVAQVL